MMQFFFFVPTLYLLCLSASSDRVATTTPTDKLKENKNYIVAAMSWYFFFCIQQTFWEFLSTINKNINGYWIFSLFHRRMYQRYLAVSLLKGIQTQTQLGKKKINWNFVRYICVSAKIGIRISVTFVYTQKKSHDSTIIECTYMYTQIEKNGSKYFHV